MANANETILCRHELSDRVNLSTKDADHARAIELAEECIAARVRLICSDEVLTELLNHFSKQGAYLRDVVVEMVERVQRDPGFTVLPQTRESFADGFKLYKKLRDKQYSLTDCSSMCRMTSAGITEVLTSDHHFSQAGFNALMR